jgi:hypothetical protein
MRLYQGSSLEFIKDNQQNIIVEKLSKEFFKHYRQNPQPSEALSWKNSLKEVSNIFDRLKFYDHGILLEYQLPLTSKRLDCLICGKDNLDEENAVIIELKQWTETLDAEGDNEVSVHWGIEYRDLLHPSSQVGQYATYLSSVHNAFQSNISLSACAYLHNYIYNDKDALLKPKFDDIRKDFPVFFKNQESTLEQYLLDKLINGDGLPTLEKIVNGNYQPSKKLMIEVGNVLKSKSPYVLLDNQLIVFDKVKSLVENADNTNIKTAVIVKGGPGTGKSVIALHLLTYFLKQGKISHYATGSKAFTETFREMFGKKSHEVFKYFNNYQETQKDTLDLLICDEAHRIRESSANRFQKKPTDKNVPQLYEILKVAKVSVFFIDDNQIVRPGEIGSIAYVKEYAKSKNVQVIEFELESQFRCNGSDGFINWLNNTLAIKNTANVIWNEGDESTFDFRIMKSPIDLENIINERIEEGNTGRLHGFVAWSEPDKQGNLILDVKIGDYQKPWNAKPINNIKLAPGIPKASLWATDPNGINQIGCVYTAQGFEFDYVGVIIGKDLVYNLENSTWVGNPNVSHDHTVKRDKKLFLDYMKNTYKILLTRGMKGCYVYFEDKETEMFFKSRMEKI